MRQAIAGKMARHYDLPVDWERDVQVTHGATEAIFAAILGLVNPGDAGIMVVHESPSRFAQIQKFNFFFWHTGYGEKTVDGIEAGVNMNEI